LPANVTGSRLLSGRVVRRLAGRGARNSTGIVPARWLREPGVRDFCGDLVHGESFRARPWWNGDVIVADFDAALAGDDRVLGELWNAIALELFARRWVDASPEAVP
jgi:hypothetical protein